MKYLKNNKIKFIRDSDCSNKENEKIVANKKKNSENYYLRKRKGCYSWESPSNIKKSKNAKKVFEVVRNIEKKCIKSKNKTTSKKASKLLKIKKVKKINRNKNETKIDNVIDDDFIININSNNNKMSENKNDNIQEDEKIDNLKIESKNDEQIIEVKTQPQTLNVTDQKEEVENWYTKYYTGKLLKPILIW